MIILYENPLLEETRIFEKNDVISFDHFVTEIISFVKEY